jgi:PST family polysaccharide transporter
LSLGIVVSNILFPLWYFLGTEKMKIISILNISAKVVFTGMIFLFVKKQNDYDITLALYSLGYLVAGIISVFILKKLQVRLITPSWQQLVHHGKRSSWYFFSKLAGNIYTFSNVLILGLISPMASVGAAIADFGIAEKLFRAMQGMFDPIVKALYPNMVKNKDANLFKRFFLLFTTANIIGCLIVYFFSYQIMTFIYGQEPSSDSVYIFQLLLFAQTITVPSLLIGYPLLGSFGYGLAVNKSIIYAAAFHLSMIGALAYIGNFNELSLTYLLICTEFFLFSFRAIAVYRHRLW